MRRWFLSYNSHDFQAAQALEAALKRKDTDATIFFAPKSLRCWNSIGAISSKGHVI